MPSASAKADSVRRLEQMKRAFDFRSDALFFTREFLRGNSFTEIETPVAIKAPAAEEYIDCPKVCDGTFLRSSPELELKQLLAAGMERIYNLGPCFRLGENGRLHRSEFTMLEWYMVHTSYTELLDFMKSMLDHLAVSLKVPRANYDPDKPWIRLPVREAFRRYADADADALAEEESLFETVLVEKVEPNLPKDAPVVLMDYPIRFGAFARKKPEDPTLAERWEVYIRGVEVANAYGELVDAAEQRKRFRDFSAKRREYGLQEYPEPTAFLKAMDSGIPEASGCAMGFDRIVMLLAGKTDIGEVVFPRE